MPVKIIAECGCNHQGDIETAVNMIRIAKACGADYVKFQKRDVEAHPEWDRPYDGPNSFGKTYYEHRRKLEFNQDCWQDIYNECSDLRIGLMVTVFDENSVEDVLDFVEIIKVGSANNMDADLLGVVKSTKKKMAVSTGMMSNKDMTKLYYGFCPDIIFHTTTCYPCKHEDVCLNVVYSMIKVFDDSEIGLSGHYASGNGAIEAAAVAFGAEWIERHFTLDRTWRGTDHAASLEPDGLRRVVKAVRAVEAALSGPIIKRVMPCEYESYKKFRGKDYNDSRV